MNYTKEWQALKEAVNSKGADGEAFVEAMKDYYEAFDDEVLDWLGRLYDHRTGGFYYSNSARDNDTVEFQGNTYELKPDIESTLQALTLLTFTKVIDGYEELPEKMREKIIKFVHSLQDEKTGLILHPQWGELAGDARRGRDLTWGKILMNDLGSSLPYDVAKKNESDKKDAPKISLPEHLSSRESFMAYLKAQKWETSAQCYSSGHNINSQIAMMKEAGLIDVAIEFFNSIQNKETGFWGDEINYDAANAYMKISTVYISAGVVIPNVEKAVMSIIDCLSSDVEVGTVTWQYNTWFSIRNIVANLRRIGAEGNELADKIISAALNAAPRALRSTKEKVLTFKKPDHAFSYYPHRAAPYSQGMPVAIPDLAEGDLNATNICIGGTIICIYEALEISDYIVSPFSDGAYARFLKSIDLKA